MSITWQDFIKEIRTSGYTGTETYPEIKAWLRVGGHNPDSIQGGNGENVDLDQLWAERSVNRLAQEKLDAIEKQTGLGRSHDGTSLTTTSSSSKAHFHAVSMNAAQSGLAYDDDGKPFTWKVLTDKPRRELAADAFEHLDDGGFGEGDEFKSLRRLGGFENASFVDYYRCILKAGRGHSKSQDRMERWSVDYEKQAQSESIDSEGGFLAPAMHRTSVMASVLDGAPWLGRLQRIEVDRRSIDMPRLDDRDRSSQEIAGFALANTGEAALIADDAFGFALSTMVLQKAAKLVRLSNELLADSVPNAGLVVRDHIANAVRLRMTEDVIRGTGVGAPVGILNSSAAFTLASRNGGNLIDYATDVLGMRERFEPGLESGAIWVAHTSTWPQLGILQITRGTEGIHVVWQANAAGDRPQTLLGFPLFFTEACSQLGTAGDIILWHPPSYIFVEGAGGPVIDSSMHLHFDRDQETLRVRHRRNGQIWRDNTLLDSRNFEVAQVVLLPA